MDETRRMNSLLGEGGETEGLGPGGAEEVVASFYFTTLTRDLNAANPPRLLIGSFRHDLNPDNECIHLPDLL